MAHRVVHGGSRFREPVVIDVIDRVPGLSAVAARLRQQMVDERLNCRRWTRQYGEDHPTVRDWTWPV